MSGARGRRGTRWILPVLIALPFVVAVTYDLVRALRTAPPADLSLLASSELRFEPAEPVFELGEARRHAAWSEPPPRLSSGWGETVEKGSWTAGHVATVEIELADAGGGALFVEARADRRRRQPVALVLAVNGLDCGTVRLRRRFEPLRFELPAGTLRRGPNLISLRIVRRPGGEPAEGRTLLVRRLVVTGADRRNIGELLSEPPLVVDHERETVAIRQAGRLILPFETPSSASVVSLKLRLSGPRPSGRCRVVVARRFVSPEQYDIVGERELDGTLSRRVRLRQRIESRGESSAVIVEVDPAAAAAGVVLSELRVEARD